MGTPFQLISRDAQRALEEFSEQFTEALVQAGVQQWAKELGFAFSSNAMKTTFPVPVSAAGYAEFKGDVKYRKLFEKSFELIPKTWQDGVSELASIVEAPDFIGWTSEPSRIATAGLSLPNEIIAGLIEDNPACWDGSDFFDDDHPVNVFDAGMDTFVNDVDGAGTNATSANLGLAKAAFRAIKAPNGKPMGLRMTHVLVPAVQEETWRDILERDLIIEAIGDGSTFGAVDNRHKGTVKLIVSDELTDDNMWYPLALNKPGMYPWVVQDNGAPEEIRSDKDSHLYKTKLMIGVAYVLQGNGGLALPHCAQRWAGTAPSE